MTVIARLATAVMVAAAWSWPVPLRWMDSTQGALHPGNDYQVQALYDQIATRTSWVTDDAAPATATGAGKDPR